MDKRLFKYISIIIFFILLKLVLISSSSSKENEIVGTGLVSVSNESWTTTRIVPTKILLTPQSLVNFENLSWHKEEDRGSLWEDEFQKPSGRKSSVKAMFFSLLLPGAGELYAGNKTGSRIFLGLEGSIWTGFFAFRTYGSWKKRDYKGFAALHAGVNLDGKSDDFFEDLTYYNNRDEYNQFAKLYHGVEAVIYPENDFWNWEWDSQDNRGRYRDLRNQSKSAYRRALYLVGLAALNRVVSVLDAARSVKKFNRKLGSEFSSRRQNNLQFSLNANFFGKNPHFNLNLSKSF